MAGTDAPSSSSSPVAAPSLTASGRDPFLDLIRCAALVAVVANHYSYSYYRWNPAGGVMYLIQERSHSWITWPFGWELAVFFFVGGAVIHKTASTMPYRAFAVRRVWRLVVPAVACLLTGAVIEVIGRSTGSGPCQPGDSALLGLRTIYLRYATQAWIGPLWFLMVFVPLTLASPFLVRRYRGRHRWLWIVAILAVVGVSDLHLYASDAATPLGFSELVWLIPWLLGFSYADGGLLRIPRRLLIAGGVAAGIALILGIAFGPWSSVLLRHPRTLETGFGALAWIPLIVAGRGALTRLSATRAGTRLVDAVGARMMSIYVWHQPAQALVLIAVAALQLQGADHVGWLWLAQKVPWVLACLLSLFVVMKVVNPLESLPAPSWLLRPSASRRVEGA